MEFLEHQQLFVSGQDGYVCYRIPSLLVSNAGTVLAFAEGRKHGWADTGEIHLLLRRSFDSGRTWEAPRLVVQQKDTTCGNPCGVIDRSNGTIFLAFCKNPKVEGGTDVIAEGKGTRTVWITQSCDDGVTWSEPVDITTGIKKPDWTWYATGPGHGAQLRTGRMLVPCDHTVAVNMRADDPNHGHVIYSDDGGKTWLLGGTVQPDGNNENQLVETADGSVYMNARNTKEVGIRAYAWSRDGGLTWEPRQVEPALIEPTLWSGCQASLARYTLAAQHGRNRILFANPACREDVRKNMTVRISYDECRTWSAGRTLHPGPSAYSDLAVAPDMNILCLYERGDEHPYQTLTLARFNLEWLTQGADRLDK